MAHTVRVDTTPLIAGKVVVGDPGLGLLAEEIAAQTATGDNGPGILYGESIDPANAGKEIRAYVANWPSAGSLFIEENGTVTWTGLPDGGHSFDYEVLVAGSSIGSATFRVQVGPYQITAANSQQATQSSSSAIQPTHFISVAVSSQTEQAASAVIRQTHKVAAASSQQANRATAGSVSQSSSTFIAAGSSNQANMASAGAIRQTHLIGVASSQQINTAAAAAIAQTASGSILIADSQQINQASAGSILQMHRVSVADSQQINRASAGRVSDGTQPIGATVASLIASVRPATRLGVAVSPVNALLREVDLSNFYYKGGAVRLHVRVAGDGDVDFDPAVLTLKTRFDSGLVTVLTYGIDPEIVRDRVGRYHADLDLLDSGTFHFRWEAAAPAGAAEGKIPVAAGRFS